MAGGSGDSWSIRLSLACGNFSTQGLEIALENAMGLVDFDGSGFPPRGGFYGEQFLHGHHQSYPDFYLGDFVSLGEIIQGTSLTSWRRLRTNLSRSQDPARCAHDRHSVRNAWDWF